jgi:hypothetical protein
MSWIGQSQTWQAGTRCRVKRDPVTISGAPVEQPWRELGLCEPVGMNNTPTENEIIDSGGGSLQLVGEHRTRQQETFEVATKDLNFNNLALFFGNAVPEAFSQANTAVVDQSIKGWPGAQLAIVKTVSGVAVRQYMIASIQAVKKGSTVLVKGTDYDYTAADLDEGFIRILAGGAVVAGDTLLVSYTPKTISGDRLIVPDFSGCGIVECDAELVWTRCDEGEKTIREFRASLSVTGNTMAVENPSTLTVRLKKLYDPTKSYPNGRFIYIKGALA